MERDWAERQRARSADAQGESRTATADQPSATTTDHAAAAPEVFAMEGDSLHRVEDAGEDAKKRHLYTNVGSHDLAVGDSPGASPGRNRKLTVVVETESVEKTIVVGNDSRDSSGEGAICGRSPGDALTSDLEAGEAHGSPPGVKSIEYVTIREDTNTVTIEESDADDDVPFHKALSLEDMEEALTADVLHEGQGQPLVPPEGLQGAAPELHGPAEETGVVLRIHSPTKVLRREAANRDQDNRIDTPSPPAPGPVLWPSRAADGVGAGEGDGGDGRGIDQKSSPPPPPPPPRCRHHASTTAATTSSACTSTTSTTATRRSLPCAAPTHYESPLAPGQSTQPTRSAAATIPLLPAATAGLSATPLHEDISEVLAQAHSYPAGRGSSSSSDCRESAQHQHPERLTPREENSEQLSPTQDEEPYTTSSLSQANAGLPLTEVMEDKRENTHLLPGGDGSRTMEVKEEVTGESGVPADPTRTVTTTVTEHWSTSDKQEAGQPWAADTLGDLDIRTKGDIVLVSHAVDTDSVMANTAKEGEFLLY